MKKLILALVGIIFFAATFVLFQIDWKVIFGVKEPLFILAGLIVFLVSIIASSIRTKYLLRALGEYAKSITELVKIEFVSKFFYYLLPGRMNIPGKAVLLSNRFSISKSHSLALTSFEYTLDLGVMLIFGLVGISLLFQNLYSLISLDKIFISLFVLLILILTFFLIPLKHFQSIGSVLPKKGKSFLAKIPDYIFRIAFKIREVWPKIILSKQSFPAIFFILLSWIIGAFATELVFLAYGQYVPILWILSITAVSILIGGLSQIPGGVGAREITLVFLFTSLGISQDLAGASALFSRLFTLAPMIIGYFFLIDFERKGGIKIF
ncbi:MAG: lysylphosphatidylglycerol synthase transmembrane domain-containing protein [Candidatus Diapherotrites archaeon]|nr:lysylphosphatidylglycerol synthase transmembrane domain-containing protein [Candidatus Diapherotrites archaeon]